MALANGGVSRRSTPAVTLLAVGLGAVAGCGGGLESASVSFWGSDLLAVGPAGYNASLAVFGNSACHDTPPNPSFSMTLNDAPLPYQNCIAAASGFLDDESFTLRLRDGGDSAEVVVADLFPGLYATIDSPGGQVAPGATFDVTVPAAVQFEAPLRFGAAFTYLDTDDPSYPGDATNATGGVGAVVHVVAPQHAGHFTLWISMSPPLPVIYPALWPKATVVSCSGLSSCSAFGAPDIGPLAVDVVPTAAPAEDLRARGADAHQASRRDELSHKRRL